MLQDNLKKSAPKKNGNLKKMLFMFGVFFVFLYVVNLVNMTVGVTPKEITYSEFYRMLQENLKSQKIKSISKIENILTGEFSDASKFTVNIPEKDDKLLDLLRENVASFDIKPLKTFWSTIIYSLGPMILFIGFLWFFSYRGAQMGNKVWSFGKARAKTSGETASAKITFNDVAGVEEAKEELTEVIEFLKDPKRFQRLGGKIPKGVLLIGPPGTGKTLLAKAVSGEAGVPFFSISGSDFVEMFVGVGASRVRDLFEQGRRAAKVSGKGCIIFIDEIDAVGRLRFSGIGGGHDEREQTLNALLVEMDGFDTQEGVILIVATNRPDTLDPALLRPGRFDRHIVVHLPDIVGREAILKVHTRNIHIDPAVDLKIVAQQTSGFSGADLANLCNEAALLAARENKESVTLQELEAAIERVMIGPTKKSRVISQKEKEITAYHEAGHALLSLLITEADPLRKVSIIPRGMTGGYTLTPPVEDKHYWSKKDLEAKLAVALGGRVSEELVLGEITTGAENDLEMVTHIAKKMVCEFGMSSRVGHMTLGRRHGPLFLGRDIVEERDYSEETAKVIDE
ncbi:MAG: ATP-dependent zinc metalloprotease FtsH, partial [Candidatus Omnitrophota bacterium]|nr:ATP-dependent zinc metalloprotease FtsH [Candidatus Omnitrophota bacterium]